MSYTDPDGMWPVRPFLFSPKQLSKVLNHAKNTEFKVSVSGTFGLQANLKFAKVVEAEVNPYSIKIFDSGVAFKKGKLEGHSQIMNSKLSTEGDTHNAPVETKSAIGAKLLGVGLAVEATQDSDNHGNSSNQKVAVKISGEKGGVGSTYSYENTGNKSIEKVETSYVIGGAVILGVELKIDFTKDKQTKKKN